MPAKPIRLPANWKRAVRSAVLHAIALAQYAIVRARGRAARLSPRRTKIDRLNHEVALLREEIRIKDARMAQLAPARRPHYPPCERMAILELRAARGWSLARTARAFLVAPATISKWLRRLDDEGEDALVQLPEPVNKYPQLVAYLVRRLQALCPTLGKRKVAEILTRAGLHLATTTVGRMLRSPPQPAQPPTQRPKKQRRVTAKRPNHVWHVDLTVVPIGGGFWTTWAPLALPQCWPFCWWVAVVIDHYSRRVVGLAVFAGQPTSLDIRACLGRAIRAAGAAPKHLICDKGVQFWCAGFKAWCKRRNIRPRYGAVGQHGSIAVVERFIRTLKAACRLLPLIPMHRAAFRRELLCFVEWYNDARPHSTLKGQTPNERYFGRFPANRRQRYEPRSRWPRGSPCPRPWALVRGEPGTKLELHVEFVGGHKHLPIVSLRRAA